MKVLGYRVQAGYEDEYIAEGAAMAHDPMEVVAEVDNISRLPDDVLLNILGRLAMAGDVRTVARTSILSWRWRSLPWPEITTVFLDIGEFFLNSDDKHGKQRQATAGLTDALARFLAAPASERVIETLRLKFILTEHDLVRRIGELVGAAAGAGALRDVELELVTDMERAVNYVPDEAEARAMLGYGERFRQLRQDCHGAFRSLTKLTLQNLWFDDLDELSNLVRGCNALEFLSLSSCGLCHEPETFLDMLMPIPINGGDDGDEHDGDGEGDEHDDDEHGDGDDHDDAVGGEEHDDDGDGEDEEHDDPPSRIPVLTIDAPRSRLRTLLCNGCFFCGVELVQAPELVNLEYKTSFILDDLMPPPISFGCNPPLQSLCLYQGSSVKLKLSELLANSGGKLERLGLAFRNRI